MDLIKAAIKRCDLRDAVALHDCDMERVPRVDGALPVYNLVGTPDITSLDWINLIDQNIQVRKPMSDCYLSIDRSITVQNLLINLSTRHEPFASQDELITEPLRPHTKLRIASDDIHRDVGIDENHRPGLPS